MARRPRGADPAGPAPSPERALSAHADQGRLSDGGCGRRGDLGALCKGEVPHVRTPIRIGEGVQVRNVAPKLGQHNAEIFGWLGVSGGDKSVERGAVFGEDAIRGPVTVQRVKRVAVQIAYARVGNRQGLRRSPHKAWVVEGSGATNPSRRRHHPRRRCCRRCRPTNRRSSSAPSRRRQSRSRRQQSPSRGRRPDPS